MNKELSLGQIVVLSLTAVPMAVFGAFGGWGTYTNIMSVFDRSATALGVVAAGEGATLILALVYIGLTMLGQSSPQTVRVGLWVLPMVASGVLATTADTLVESVVFAVTPMGMCVSAEGLGLLSRRIVIFRTGVDMEAQRRNAEIMQKIAFHNAQSQNHPEKKQRAKSALKAWELAKKVGQGDAQLGANLVEVQRVRMTGGADTALVAMYGLSASDSPVVPVRPVSDSPAVPVPDSDPVDPDHSLSVRVYLKMLLIEQPTMAKDNARHFVDWYYGPDRVTKDNFDRSWTRANNDIKSY